MDLDFDLGARAELRKYQQEAYEAACVALDEGSTPLLIMATGTGKTIVFSEVHRSYLDRREKSLVLAHRDELVNQARDKMKRQTGYMPGKEKANDWADLSDLIVAGSVQSLQRTRLERWPADHFKLITIDEAHHTAAKTYQNIIDRFVSSGGACLLGVTATPDRADEKQLGNTFNKIAYEYPLHRAIKEGNLSRIVGLQVKDFNIDLSGLKIVAGDFSDDDLAEALEKYIAPMAASIKEKTEGISTLVFMPNVESSRLMAEALTALGVEADYISGSMEQADRQRVLYRYSQGHITHLVSCNILLEGYDEPRTSAIAMCRPTGSRTVYTQAVGRGTRLYPGKDKCLLVEFTYNSSRLKLVTAYELFSTAGYGERVQEKAKASAGEEVDYLLALEQAHESMYNTKNIIQRMTLKAHGFVEFDPLSVGDLLGIDVTGEFDISYQGRKLTGPATEKQKDLLRRYNIANIDSLDKAQASVLIDTLSKKGFLPMQGIATPGQVQYLRRLGMPIRDEVVTKAQASMMINLLKGG
jgi:superfamily II DNA or RNA helicase